MQAHSQENPFDHAIRCQKIQDEIGTTHKVFNPFTQRDEDIQVRVVSRGVHDISIVIELFPIGVIQEEEAHDIWFDIRQSQVDTVVSSVKKLMLHLLTQKGGFKGWVWEFLDDDDGGYDESPYTVVEVGGIMYLHGYLM
ncbi:MAG: hypothetical protein CMF55_00330 [Legionellales bacterium]|nr:hypothetical protein [Legionellales bacterium]